MTHRVVFTKGRKHFNSRGIIFV